MLLPDLPYLLSGKVDRKALREQYSQRNHGQVLESGSLSPRTNTIIDVISSVLGARIDQTTQLTAAGLDSLSAIRISSQLERAGFPPSNAAVLPPDLDSSRRRSAQDLSSCAHNAVRRQSPPSPCGSSSPFHLLSFADKQTQLTDTSNNGRQPYDTDEQCLNQVGKRCWLHFVWLTTNAGTITTMATGKTS